jgi:GNAT superfamily N-acetyltransferase
MIPLSVVPFREGVVPTVRAVPASIQHWDLLRALFAGSPGVSGCWCMWPLRPPQTHRPDQEANSAAMRARLRSGDSPGLIALVCARAVGWCALGPRDRYPQYVRNGESAAAWAIPCLYIDPGADRREVAHALIAAAADRAAAHGATVLDGPPPWWRPGDAAAVAQITATFVENGFSLIGPGARMPEFRRVLV